MSGELFIEQLETPIQSLMTKREMLTQFASDYASKQLSLQSELEEVGRQLDEAIAEEEAEVLAIANVKDQLDDMALSKDLHELEVTHTTIVSRFNAYKDMVDTNDTRAALVLASIEDSQPMIADINKTIAELCTTIAHVSSAISKLRKQ